MNTQTIEENVDLTGKTAIVTGGATGIGQAIALALAEYGAAVMIADSDRDTAYETVSAIKAKGGMALAMGVDLSDGEDAGLAVETAVECFGRLDILVNAASQFSFLPGLSDIDQLWRRTVVSHVRGVGQYCQAAAEEMMEEGHGGRIINIASMEAMQPVVGPEALDPREMSVAFQSKRLAEELAPHGITVNALAPNVVQRPDWQMQAAGLYKAAGGTPHGAPGSSPSSASPEQAVGGSEIATVVLFLVSPAAKNITGNLVSVG